MEPKEVTAQRAGAKPLVIYYDNFEAWTGYGGACYIEYTPNKIPKKEKIC